MAGVEIRQALSRPELEMAKDLLVEYCSWVVSLEKDSLAAPPLSGLPTEIENLPGVYALPYGRLLLATNEGEAAGCVCLKPRSRELAEVKRLYVRPSQRGHNIGTLLVSQLVEEAKSAGYKRVVLDSHYSMKGAHHLYEKAGFQYVEPFDDFPKELAHVAVFMQLELD